jgi:hypothetical protein
MPMTRVSDSVLQSADQLKARLQAITGERTWRSLTRNSLFTVALLAAEDCTDEQLAAYLAGMLETGDTDDTSDTP